MKIMMSSLRAAALGMCLTGAVALSSGAAFAQSVTLTGETGFDSSMVQVSLTSPRFTDEVEKRTNGRVTVRWSFGGALVGPTEIGDALMNGVIDIAALPPGMTPGVFPLNAPLPLFDLNISTDLGQGALNYIYQTLSDEFPEIEGEFTARGVKRLAFYPAGEYYLAMRKPIETLADMKGLKVRAPAEPSLNLINSSGATGVNIPYTEVYTSLQSGLIDGVYTTGDSITGAKMYEVAPYVYRINAGPILPSSTLAISLKAWSEISAEDQAIIMEVSRDSLKWTGEMLDAREAEIRKIWQETAGVHYAEFPAAARAEWAANSPDFLGNLAKKLDEAGMPGTPIADRIKELVAGYNSGELKMPE